MIWSLLVVCGYQAARDSHSDIIRRAQSGVTIGGLLYLQIAQRGVNPSVSSPIGETAPLFCFRMARKAPDCTIHKGAPMTQLLACKCTVDSQANQISYNSITRLPSNFPRNHSSLLVTHKAHDHVSG